MPVRFSSGQFQSAARAGAPRLYASFADDTSWADYQEAWAENFDPQEPLPTRRDPERPAAWKRLTRQHAAIEKARAKQPLTLAAEMPQLAQSSQGERASVGPMQVDAPSAGELVAAWTAAVDPMDTSEAPLVAASSEQTDTMEVAVMERALPEVQNSAVLAPVIPAKSTEAGTAATRELAALARESLLEAEGRLAEAFATARSDPESAGSQHALAKLAEHSRRLEPARREVAQARRQKEAEEAARLQAGVAAAVQQEQECLSAMEVESVLHPKPRGYAPRDPSAADADTKCSWDAALGCWVRSDGSAHEQKANAARTAERAEAREEREAWERQLRPVRAAMLRLEAPKPDGRRQGKYGCFCWGQSDGLRRCTCECCRQPDCLCYMLHRLS
jgi:hypothetical protein